MLLYDTSIVRSRYGRKPTRYMWYLASNESTREAQYLPTVVKLDTLTNETVSWFSPYTAPVSPVFVPKYGAGQGADEDAGVPSQALCIYLHKAVCSGICLWPVGGLC